MRIRQVVLPLVAAVALVGSLTACSGSSGSPPAASSPAASSASPAPSVQAVDLVGTRWTVEGRKGTTVRFDGIAVTVAVGDLSSSFSWSAQGDQVLIGARTSGLSGPVDASWLTSTASVRRDGSGLLLVDANGSTTARLAPDGTADGTTPTSLLTAATVGKGVVDAPPSAIEGRWTVAGDVRTAITFTGGTWSATTSCTTGAVGGRGAYRVLPGGRLLVVRTMTPIRGCPIVDGPVVGHASAITSIARAASFRVSGDTLTLFDRDGTGLGSLVRG
ncbi:hypothetical protein [Amnibacterium kyonggiense]|uniref:META domain-containing protein n=1 Tax=Amnibacterium kyonggiense TaxID=595671 RepID=A0A4R7FS79_9MICO|nr:hypothetical protein [Amnibacterium kyonggiense]TDS80715.1 hypothetical protein CLV52_1282 [Amnibacterium kyonggiense]